MLRALALALVTATSVACASKPPAAEAQFVTKEIVRDNEVPFNIELGYLSRPPDEVEIVIKMSATSIDQTDKLVINVETHGFVLSEGTAEWNGFIQPRQRYKHQLVLKLLDDEQSARATVSVRRSMDSELLWQSDLLFESDGSSLRYAG